MSSPNALGALRAAGELGLTIPGDLSIVTFDDHPFADFFNTPLTAASQNVEELGRQAALLIFEQIKTGRLPKRMKHRIEIEIVERSSIAPVKT